MEDSPIWATLAASILSGGLVTGLLSYYINKLTKKREIYYEMSKHKMDVISESLPIYAKLGSYYFEFSEHLGNLKNIERMFFCACKIIFYEDIIFEKYGTIQLDDLQAEEIITLLEFNIPEINLDTKGEMKRFVERCPDYRAFHKALSITKTLVNEFRIIFEKVSKEPRSIEIPNVEQKCRWFSELIFIEINEVYQLWYNTHPVKQVSTMSADLKQYLILKYPNYYNRIHKWEIGGYLK
jgi:hypothetical protein